MVVVISRAMEDAEEIDERKREAALDKLHKAGETFLRVLDSLEPSQQLHEIAVLLSESADVTEDSDIGPTVRHLSDTANMLLNVEQGGRDKGKQEIIAYLRERAKMVSTDDDDDVEFDDLEGVIDIIEKTL